MRTDAFNTADGTDCRRLSRSRQNDVTTSFHAKYWACALTREQVQKLSDEVGEGRSLLILCGAFRVKNLDAFPNLTVKKIPKAVLARCEWGKDDYSLEIRSLPIRQPEEKETADGQPRSKEERRATVQQPSLFALPAGKGGAK